MLQLKLKLIFNGFQAILWRRILYLVRCPLKTLCSLTMILIICSSFLICIISARVVADNGVWDYAKYGFPAPSGDATKAILQYGFRESWQKYQAPAAIKAGEALGIDAAMIGGWTYHEAINHVFLDNCDDSESNINTPCMVGAAEEWNWQVGYGFRPFDGWVNPGKPHKVLHKALQAMHPGETIRDIIVNTINESQRRSAEYSTQWPGDYRQQITNPAAGNVPDNLTVEILWDNKANPTYRQLLTVLLMDDDISAYCVGYVIRSYMGLGEGMAAAFGGWGAGAQQTSNDFQYVYNLGLPSSSVCAEDTQNELYAIYSETTFYDRSGCDPNAANVGLGVSADGFVFPQRTTKAKLAQYSNGNWLTCTNPISSMTNGTRDIPEENDNLCHHDYLAADIGNDTNTPVVAPRPGRITSVSESSSGNNGLMIHLYSDKGLGGDGLWYYFAHCLPGSQKVAIGDTVQAGDELAVVGTTQDAQGTYPHTHFDASPSENYFSRTADGTHGPLLDVNPALKAAYEGLPEN
jgi:murein DD-endopeptidase MepM/ murein hydrolase activator NlpD